MLSLPDPLREPDAFLTALLAQDAPVAMARDAGCAVHPLSAEGQPAPALAALHAAGARALAASLARGAAPMLLVLMPPPDATYPPALTEGLMGYERIHTAQGPAAALILILPPTAVNSYWQR